MESPKFDVKIEVKDAGGGDDGGSGSSEGREGKDDDETSSKSSSQMQGLLEEFTKIYTDRLHRVEKTTSDPQDPQYLKNKVTVLESWVHDLGDQNEVLVATVEELEREAGDRVALLEDRLSKMAATTRDSCLSLRDHQMQVSSLVADKVGLERETEMLEEKVLGLERKSITLKEENNSLQNDLNNLVQVITRARLTGQWEADNLTFSCLTPEQVFGPVLSSSRRSSQSLKDSQRDYIHSMFEDHMRKDCSSSRSSFSNLQDGDGSMYSGRGSDKDMVIMRLRSDLRCLQTTHEETNQQLLDRDKQIADLQTQLTELYHELAETQTEVNNVNTALQEVRHRTRQENVEITRKKEVVRQALSKQSREDSKRGSCTSLCDLESVLTGENNIESQLSENIDVLAGRLAELEDECQGLRDQYASLKDSHAVCAPTITMLQDQLARSQQSQVELRTVLTEEVAERHDQLVALGEKLKDEEQKHHETRMQVHLKNEVIKDLRKHLREIRERQPECKSDIMHLEAAVQTTVKDSKARETQTDPTTSDNKNLNSMKGAVINGFHASSTAHPAQVSRLENELAEKNILLKELQTHLATSRQELHLKDETLSKLEKKLDSVRREGGESDDRMQYLMGQLTNLQLEVGRTHGQAEQFRRQVENKNQLIQKIEQENISLSQQLNDKSLSLEKFQRDMLSISTDLEKRKNEVSEQKVTISSLQEALVSSKRMCDDLRSRLDSDVSDSMLHQSQPPQMCASSPNSYSNCPGVTKSIPEPHGDPSGTVTLPNACEDQNGFAINVPISFPISERNYMLNMSQPSSLQSGSIQSLSDPNAHMEAMMPDVRPSNCSAKENIVQNLSCAMTPDVLSSCNGTHLSMLNSQCSGHGILNGTSHNHQTLIGPYISKNGVNNEAQNAMINSSHSQSGRVYDV